MVTAQHWPDAGFSNDATHVSFQQDTEDSVSSPFQE